LSATLLQHMKSSPYGICKASRGTNGRVTYLSRIKLNVIF